jgi:hypothetical protein
MPDCRAIARATEEKTEPASVIFSPVARDYPSRVIGGFFRPPRFDCSRDVVHGGLFAAGPSTDFRIECRRPCGTGASITPIRL